MSRSTNLVDAYYNRDVSIHKPGFIPNSSRVISPITANRHKYELKQRIWPSKSVEAWFANHSSDERRAVYSFLDTLYQTNDDKRSPSRRFQRAASSSSRRQISSQSLSSKRDLGEVLESLESFRLPENKPNEICLPEVNGTSNSKHPLTPDDKSSRRYLSQTWRVINPRSDVEPSVRPEHNSSSFFNYTKKTYPEYFFIHPDWY